MEAFFVSRLCVPCRAVFDVKIGGRASRLDSKMQKQYQSFHILCLSIFGSSSREALPPDVMQSFAARMLAFIVWKTVWKMLINDAVLLINT